jgi:hypothetical protein
MVASGTLRRHAKQRETRAGRDPRSRSQSRSRESAPQADHVGRKADVHTIPPGSIFYQNGIIFLNILITIAQDVLAHFSSARGLRGGKRLLLL